MAQSTDENQNLETGQEGTTGNDRGMQSPTHNVTDDGGTGTRTDGPGDGGSSSQTNAAGSDGSGRKGSIAAGKEGAGGDSVKGVQSMDVEEV